MCKRKKLYEKNRVKLCKRALQGGTVVDDATQHIIDAGNTDRADPVTHFKIPLFSTPQALCPDNV